MSLSLAFSAWWLCVNSLLNVVFGSFSINTMIIPFTDKTSQISRQAAVNSALPVLCMQCKDLLLQFLGKDPSISVFTVGDMVSLDFHGRAELLFLYHKIAFN